MGTRDLAAKVVFVNKGFSNGDKLIANDMREVRKRY